MTSSIATSGPATALDPESSNDDQSQAASAATPAPAHVILGRADEPPTDLPRSPNKQCVLYPVDDNIKAGILNLWWDSTPYGVELRSRRQFKWGHKARDDKSVWSYFVDAADVMQGAPKVLCKYCWRNHPHPAIKKFGDKYASKTSQFGSMPEDRKKNSGCTAFSE